MPSTSDSRNPIESIASDFAESMRHGRRDSIDDVVESNPELESELRDLLPVIKQLEHARRSHAQRPGGLASLGASRPDRLGDFEIVRQIGRGGMGVVFEAVQQSLGRKVALKVLPKSLLSDEEQLRRFEREARMAGSLHHTNIVPVFGVGDDQGFHYYVMQRIEGRGLDRLLADSLKLTPKQTAWLGQQAAAALAYAHDQNVLHRDIKPANVIVDQELNLWVADFGVAKAIEAEAVTKTGDVVGTLRYMAPEQIVGNSDVRSDIYSLGVTLYEVLAGRPAVDDASIREALVARRPAPKPPSLRQLNPAVPRDLETILDTAMSIDPRYRYQHARDLELDLQRFLDGEPISVRPLSMIEKSSRWAKRNPAVAALSAFSFLLLASIAVVSSYGFVQVQQSLGREQSARESAEETAEMASNALNQIFARFTADSGVHESSVEFTSTPALSAEAAEMLEELLHYYDAFADRTDSGDELKQATKQARFAIGDIHFRLGHYDKAISAFELALQETDKRQSPAAIKFRQARIHNRIGLAHRMNGNDEAAQEQHQVSLDLLAQLSDLEPETGDVRFERAKTHYLLATHVIPGRRPDSMPPLQAATPPPRPDDRRGFRPRRENFEPPPALVANQAHLQSAITELQKLRSEDPKNIEYALALAASLNQRELAAESVNGPTANEETAESVSLLRSLHEQYPNNDRIRFALADILTGLNVFASERPPAFASHDVERLKEAVGHLELLADANPNVPNYANAVAHAHFKLAVLLERRAVSDRGGSRRELQQQAGFYLRQAADRYAALIRQHPDAMGYRAWYAIFLQSQSGNAFKSDLLEHAQESMERSIEQWNILIKNHPEQPISWHALPTAYEILSHVHRRLGNYDQADHAQQQAEMCRALRDLENEPR